MSAPPPPPPMAFPSSMPPSPVLAMPGGMTALASQSPAASQSSQASSILTRLGANNDVATALGDNAGGTVATAPVGVPGSTIVTTNAQGQATTETQAPPASITATFLTSTDIGGVPTQVLTTAVVPNPSARSSSTGGSNQSATIGAAVGSTLFVLILLTVCTVLRRKKQRRMRATDLSTHPAPSHNSSLDGGVSFETGVHDGHSIDLENHPGHEDMTQVDRDTTPASITSDSTARIKRVPVPAFLNNPFGDEARVNESFFAEPDPFADPERIPPGPPPPLEIQVTAPSRLSAGSSLDGEGYASGELTPKAIVPSRLSAGSSINGGEFSSGERSPKAITPSRLSAGSSINGADFSSGERSPKANQPSRLSAGSSVAEQDYTPSIAGTIGCAV
ncbi:hypothetical protein JB92DRAFT_2859312 [Gautieria morchelliformis]|nr:hypothetical protein JB92DRAFT_2859312 [Gautieria morchelliformis]